MTSPQDKLRPEPTIPPKPDLKTYDSRQVTRLANLDEEGVRVMLSPFVKTLSLDFSRINFRNIADHYNERTRETLKPATALLVEDIRKKIKAAKRKRQELKV